MLSGSWRRSISHQPAGAVVANRGVAVCGVPSGTVVLEAQYDYNYRSADGRQVCIREGERFILLKKTNADWWQVGNQRFIVHVLLMLYLLSFQRDARDHIELVVFLLVVAVSVQLRKQTDNPRPVPRVSRNHINGLSDHFLFPASAQVRRIGAASKAKPLYVPATYVTEVPIAPMPSPQRIFMTTSLSTELSSHPRVSLTKSPTQAQYSDKYQGERPPPSQRHVLLLFLSVHSTTFVAGILFQL